MKYLSRILTAALILMMLPLSFAQARSSGVTGFSQGAGCNACHSGGTAPNASLTGPTTVEPGLTYTYTLTMSGGQQLSGGLNVSATGGTLVGVGRVIVTNGELHQYTPDYADANGNISWTFDWTAPLGDADVVLYAAVLSSNDSFTLLGDAGATTSLTITVGAGGGGQPVETGESLYIANCQGCHDPYPGQKAGSTTAAIQTAIDNNTGNMGSLSFLTATQVQMIADFLAGDPNAPQPPAADPGGPYTAALGDQILFDGTASSDPDGTIVSYDWDFGDGNTATGVSPAYTYATVGAYTVTLTVTDNSNMIDTVTTTANVAEGTPPPPAYDGVALYGTNCAGCHQPLASSTKAGRTAAQIQNAINANIGGMGSATLTALVPEEVQAIADALGGGTPTPQAPVANAGSAYTGVVGTAVQFNGASSTDADGTIDAYSWNFGDGNTGTGATPTHTYAAAGLYTVSLTVTDNDGMTGSATTTANIGAGTPPPPVLDGLALYGTYCSSCHGAAPGAKEGRTATQIQNAINGNAGGMGSLSTLSSAEVQAIADAIAPTGGGGGTPPPASDGEGLYNTYCASCHGAGGEGGIEEGVLGDSADEISDAIDEEEDMQYLSSLLSNSEISLIADYLNGGTGGGDPGTITVTKKSQYDAYCGACHGPEGRGGAEEDVRGESAGGIWDAISQEQEMNYLSSLSDVIVEGIADYLRGDDNGTIEIPAPSGGGGGGSTDGLALYTANCAGCHGAAPGTKAGRTSAQIQAAIDGNAGGMGGLSGLTAAEVQAIADAIATGGGGGGGGGTPPDGNQLYADNCSGCHGTAPGSKAGRTSAQIQAAIDANAGGMGGLSGLTAEEVQAIADAIATGGGGGGGTTVTKESLYDTYCGACHGAEGRGGAEGDVRGESASGIWDAISQESEMNYLSGLSDTVVQAISDYLNGDNGTVELPSGGGGGGGSTDGLALYATNCSGCHGNAPGTKAGRSAAQIQAAIDANAGGMGGLSGLTAAEVQAIADAIATGGGGGGGTPPDGDQLYADNCSGCHGNAPGEMAGSSASQIQSAINNNTGGMGGLSGLSSAEVQAIADAIATGGGGGGGGGGTPPAGDQLYADNCAGCHGTAPGSKAGRTAAQIQAAINGDAGGMGSLSGLTAEEVQAIANAIGSGAPPAPTTPEGLYVTYCGSCHGADGSGGTEEGVRGASAGDIRDAIEKESEMTYLDGLLSRSSIEAIADYLSDSNSSNTRDSNESESNEGSGERRRGGLRDLWRRIFGGDMNDSGGAGAFGIVELFMLLMVFVGQFGLRKMK